MNALEIYIMMRYC